MARYPKAVCLLALLVSISLSNLCDSGFGQFNSYPVIYEYGTYAINIYPDKSPGTRTIVGMVDDQKIIENNTPDQFQLTFGGSLTESGKIEAVVWSEEEEWTKDLDYSPGEDGKYEIEW